MNPTFWSDFWPNFAATIVGVAAGIPIGFWLNRHAERSAAERRRKEIRAAEARRVSEEKQRTREALEQLEPAIRAHAGWFKILGAWSNMNEYHEGPLAELWIVLRGQIVPAHLSDRRLFGDLAVHFERCVRFDELVRLRASLSMAGPPLQQTRTQTDEAAIKTRLNNMTKAVGADPEKIANRVAGEIASLQSPA
ncbi:MAG: hypothetical protein HY775_05805 [Acidobacteria bacterium]|nr:hypothetical protein [Acidobacteriota bacterium]